MRSEVHRTVSVEDVHVESSNINTIYFKDLASADAVPGQYLMIWLPGIDEVPMSLSTIGDDGLNSITVRAVGEATEALCGLRVGDEIGIRGPFGRGFRIDGSKPLLVGGGTGISALSPLAFKLVENGVEPTFIIGSRTFEELIFRDRLHGLLEGKLVEATDDGTFGYHGYASECAFTLIEQGFDSIYTCGPELMIASIFKKAEFLDIPVQASLERHIKCSMGICGSCAIGPYRVCKDGPVFDTDMLRSVVNELGVSRLDSSGRMIPVEH
ncbi:MAG: dihydroorotate dehydrogenase electron transfer subunit [Candidatus Bathyarchaeia archaeon]